MIWTTRRYKILRSQSPFSSAQVRGGRFVSADHLRARDFSFRTFCAFSASVRALPLMRCSARGCRFAVWWCVCWAWVSAASTRRNRSRAGTGTGPFFGELSHLATHTLAENTDLSPSLPARERLHEAGLTQGLLFDQDERRKQSGLDTVTDQIRERFGASALQRGAAVRRERRED